MALVAVMGYVSVCWADLCTVEESSICGHGIDLLHYRHMDDDMHVIIQTANLPLKLTKNQYRTVLAMILEIFRKTLASVLAQVSKCPKCGGTHFPIQTCCQTWCRRCFCLYASLEVLRAEGAK